MHSLKKLVAKVTGAGTAGSLPWGRGFAPKQLSVGAVPAGAGGLASLEETPPGKTHSSLLPLPSPRKSQLPTFLLGQPASFKQKCSRNKTDSPPVYSALSQAQACLLGSPAFAPSSLTHSGLAGQKASHHLCARGTVQSDRCCFALFPPTPIRLKELFRSFFVPQAQRGPVAPKPPPAAFLLGGESRGVERLMEGWGLERKEEWARQWEAGTMPSPLICVSGERVFVFLSTQLLHGKFCGATSLICITPTLSGSAPGSQACCGPFRGSRA